MTMEFWEKLGMVVVLLAALAVSSAAGTEFLKATLRKLEEKCAGIKWLAWIQGISPKDVSSWLVALAVAAAGVQKFSLDFFGQFDTFKNVDPTALKIINTIALWLASNVAYKRAVRPLSPLVRGK